MKMLARMRDCTKSGCRRIKYICEDCGRVISKADLSEIVNAIVSDREKEIDRLKAELEGQKRESANWHQETKNMILERDLWKAKTEKLVQMLIPIANGHLGFHDNESTNHGSISGCPLCEAQKVLADFEKEK